MGNTTGPIADPNSPGCAPWPAASLASGCLESALYWAGGISILTGQSFRWIDLRIAGPLATPLLILWLISLVGLGISRCLDIPANRVITQQIVQRRIRLNRLWLIPSWMILLTLLANTFWYYHLLRQRHGDLQIGPPMCLLVLLAMAAWLGTDPARALRSTDHPLPPPSNGQRLIRQTWPGCAFGVLFVLLMIWVFGFEFRANPPPASASADLGVVLGHAVLPGDICDRSMRNRTLTGVTLFKEHRIGYLMLSGSASDGPTVSRNNQPDAMLKVALAGGVPRNRIILDFHGDNTRFTAFNTQQIMRLRGFTTVVAISSDYHLPRTRLAFAQIGIHAWTVASVNHQWRQTDPFSMLRELIAYPVYYFDQRYHHPDGKP